MDVRDFDFHLPPELIAQEPAADRDAARLLVVNRAASALVHSSVSALPDLLSRGDLLVVNNTRVFPARLLGHRVPSGGAVECLLIRRLDGPQHASRSGRAGESSQAEFVPTVSTTAPGTQGPVPGQRLAPSAQRLTPSAQIWEALMHPGQKLKAGGRILFEGAVMIHGEVLERRFYGRRVIALWTDDDSSVDAAVDAIGHVPLPPYIKRSDAAADRERYQTVFACERGSVAAPTAGLHFSGPLTAKLLARGIEVVEITLHVGYGTFQPVRVERVEDHRVEAESYRISARAASAINAALEADRRVIAVGTTTTRALESVARLHDGRVAPDAGETDLFIHPGFQFRILRGLMTNFHLPQSSLLMLVAAFAGRERVLNAYEAAVAERYRFYSYGDAMLIL